MAAPAAAVSWQVAALLSGRRRFSVRFAAMRGTLICATAALAALFFYLQPMAHFGPAREPFLSGAWLEGLLFSGATSAYPFAATGLRLFLPFGLPVLFGAALAFAVWRAGRRQL